MKQVLQNLKILSYMRKLNIKSAMEYKKSFLMQVVFMMINNSFFIGIRYLFFLKFGTIGGMNFQDMLLLNINIVVIYAFLYTLLGGFEKISELVENGGLDSRLLLPKNTLLLLLGSSLKTSAIGDFFFGITMMFFLKVFSFIMFCKIIFVCILAALTFVGFMIFFHSLAFFRGSSAGLSRAMLETILGPSHYPYKIYEKTFFAYIFMTLIPVFFISFLPWKFVSNAERGTFSLIFLGAVIFFSLGYFTFKAGLKKYEGGNAMTVNL